MDVVILVIEEKYYVASLQQTGTEPGKGKRQKKKTINIKCTLYFSKQKKRKVTRNIL